MNNLFSNHGTLNLEDMILIYKKDVLNVLKCILILPKAYKHQAFEYVLILLKLLGIFYDKAHFITSV